MTLKEKLSAIQTKIKAPKNLTNKFGGYKYRNAEGILEAVKPYEKEYSVLFTLSDTVIQMGDRYYVKATASIWDTESDDTISVSAYAREALEKKGMDDSQITGTASSYARKYALNGLLLLDDTKDADSDEDSRNDPKEQNPKATQAQIKTIKSQCEMLNVNLDAWLQKKGYTLATLTGTQAGEMLNTLRVQAAKK